MKEQVSQTKKGNVFRASMYVAVLIGLAGFLIFSILAAITFGNADLSLKDVYSVIVYKLFHIKKSVCLCRRCNSRCCMADPTAQSPVGSGSWNGSFCMWRSNAGNRAEPAGRSVCTWYFIRRVSWCNAGNHARNRKLSWRELCRSYCFYWRDDHLLCSYCYCKYGRKGNIS